LVEPYRSDLVVAVECIFTWYWFADLCEDHGIPFELGHALYVKAIHGGKGLKLTDVRDVVPQAGRREGYG
jgi:hypothetical protein